MPGANPKIGAISSQSAVRRESDAAKVMRSGVAGSQFALPLDRNLERIGPLAGQHIGGDL